MKKLFASDYDGTLFFQKPYSDKDVEAIRRLQKEGHLFTFNTGRGYKQIEPHYAWDASVIRPDLYVCNTGSVIADRNGKVLEENTISYEQVQKLHELYPKAPLSFSIDGDFVLLDHVYFDEFFEKEPPIERIDSIEALRGKKIHSVGLHFGSIEEARREAQRIASLMDLGVHVNRENIDISIKGVDKGTGLKKAARLLGADRTYAVGDSFNDLPALLAADRGFLMSTAPEPLKQQALASGIRLVDSVAQAIDLALQDQ